MASRLAVLMIQSRAPSAAADRLVEEVIGNLIGTPGIDLILIGALSEIGDASSDRLTLESITADVAVLDWQSPERILQGLANVDFHGQRAGHSHDPQAEAVAAGNRKIFAFDLREFADSTELNRALEKLNSDRAVRTFSIGLGPSTGDPPMAKPKPTETTEISTQAKCEAWKSGSDDHRLVKDVVEDCDTRESPSRNSFGTSQSQLSSRELDDLIDELDRADP